MIFAVDGHIEMIRNGLSDPHYQEIPTFPKKLIPAEIVIKTQTRRINRGIYHVGKSYAVQRKRGVKAEPDIRIVMDDIRKEKHFTCTIPSPTRYFDYYISVEDANAEGGYTPAEYEKEFLELTNRMYSWGRWVFKFHVVAVMKKTKVHCWMSNLDYAEKKHGFLSDAWYEAFKHPSTCMLEDGHEGEHAFIPDNKLCIKIKTRLLRDILIEMD